MCCVCSELVTVSSAEAIFISHIVLFSREFSRLPHLAGSDRNNELGDKIADTWRSYGFQVKKYIYNTLLSYPGDQEGKMNQVGLLPHAVDG